MKYFVLVALLTFKCLVLVAQSDSVNASQAKANAAVEDTVGKAKIYMIRSTGYIGSAVNLRVLLDSVMRCKVRNNRYALFYVEPGTHTFNATSWDAPKARGKLGLKMPVEAGKTYYMTIRLKQKFMELEITVEEITYNTASPQLEKLKRDECD